MLGRNAMTPKQRNLIMFLDNKCKQQGINLNSNQEDMLGEGWVLSYANITPDYASEVINKMKSALGMSITPLKKRGRRK